MRKSKRRGTAPPVDDTPRDSARSEEQVRPIEDIPDERHCGIAQHDRRHSGTTGGFHYRLEAGFIQEMRAAPGCDAVSANDDAHHAFITRFEEAPLAKAIRTSTGSSVFPTHR